MGLRSMAPAQNALLTIARDDHGKAVLLRRPDGTESKPDTEKKSAVPEKGQPAAPPTVPASPPVQAAKSA